MPALVPSPTAATRPSASAPAHWAAVVLRQHGPAPGRLGPHRRLALQALTLGWVCTWAPGLTAAPAAVRLTLLDGEAQVLQGSQWTGTVQGQALPPGSVLHTGPRTGLLRLEWPDQTALDLGPDARVMLLPAGFRARQGKAPLAYVLRGWVKLSGGAQGTAGGVLTPRLEVLPLAAAGGAVVLQVQPAAVQVFAENSATEVVLRPSGASHGLAAGAWFDAEPPALPRPAGAWMAQVPRAFRDPIPRRAAAFDGQKIAGTPLPPPGYAVLADWLTLAEPELRRQWPTRLAPWLQDPTFRRAVQAGLQRHPEWAPVLNPPR